MKKIELWWLSFADPTRPKGEQWLGVAIVQGVDAVSAVQESHWRGCNPGGEVAACELPGALEKLGPKNEWMDRLLSREEVDAFNAKFRPGDA
jgi:hypothetical protein